MGPFNPEKSGISPERHLHVHKIAREHGIIRRKNKLDQYRWFVSYLATDKSGANSPRFLDAVLKANSEKTAARKRKCAAIILDLVDFHGFNGRNGTPAGDQHLCNLVAVLYECLREALKRPDDFVCRWGGDEFVILLWDVQTSQDAKRIYNRIMKHLNDEHSIVLNEAETNVYEPFQIHSNYYLLDDLGNLTPLLHRLDVTKRKRKRGENPHADLVSVPVVPFQFSLQAQSSQSMCPPSRSQKRTVHSAA